MGLGAGSSGGMFGMSMTTDVMGGVPEGPQPPPPPMDTLSFTEWPTGLWWARSDDRGHLVVLTAWGTSCRACVEALPQLDAIGRQFASQEVHIYAINIEPDPTRFPALLRTLPAYPAILVDPSGQRLAVVLGLGSIPTTWILDGKDKVSWYEEGWDSNIAAALRAKLNVFRGGGT